MICEPSPVVLTEMARWMRVREGNPLPADRC